MLVELYSKGNNIPIEVVNGNGGAVVDTFSAFHLPAEAFNLLFQYNIFHEKYEKKHKEADYNNFCEIHNLPPF
jgi:hypothetical protein